MSFMMFVRVIEEFEVLRSRLQQCSFYTKDFEEVAEMPDHLAGHWRASLWGTENC